MSDWAERITFELVVSFPARIRVSADDVAEADNVAGNYLDGLGYLDGVSAVARVTRREVSGGKSGR